MEKEEEKLSSLYQKHKYRNPLIGTRPAQALRHGFNSQYSRTRQAKPLVDAAEVRGESRAAAGLEASGTGSTARVGEGAVAVAEGRTGGGDHGGSAGGSGLGGRGAGGGVLGAGGGLGNLDVGVGGGGDSSGSGRGDSLQLMISIDIINFHTAQLTTVTVSWTVTVTGAQLSLEPELAEPEELPEELPEVAAEPAAPVDEGTARRV